MLPESSNIKKIFGWTGGATNKGTSPKFPGAECTGAGDIEKRLSVKSVVNVDRVN